MLNLRTFQNKTICVAISGGADSVALAHYLKTQAKENGFSLIALHCQHGIRGEESLEDMRFVRALCKEWELPLTIVEGDCLALAKQNSQSVETAAREFRRAAYARMIDEKKADFIATAHHLSDEAETVLFRLARGSALSGVVGMREQDGYILRPFLTKKKEEIYVYLALNAESEGLAFVGYDKNFTDTPSLFKVQTFEDVVKAYYLIDKLMYRFGMEKHPENAEPIDKAELQENCGFGYRVRL